MMAPVVPPAVPIVTVEASVGAVPNTAAPEPVSLVSAPDRLAEEKEPKEVVLPLEVMTPVRFALVVTVPALPVIEPVMGLVTLRLASVPTLVKEEAVTPEFNVAPVKVPAAAVMVMPALPSKLTPLMAAGW